MCEGMDELSIGGFLSRQRIVEKCPSIEEALNSGLTYTILRWQIVELCPELMRLLSEADNAKHDTFRKETRLQTMLNIHARAIACSATAEAEFRSSHPA